MINVLSMSGGKDSAACALYLREAGLRYQMVFFDTGWEHRQTYEHLDYLADQLGPIEVRRYEVDLSPDLEAIARSFEERLGRYSSMVRLILHKNMFPSRRRRFCTQYLKGFVARAYFDSLDDECLNIVGIRADESAARSQMPEREWSEDYDCEVWRPIIGWTEADVIDIHRRYNLRPNPLYLQGTRRVGCWPCIFARKRELRMLGMDDERVAIIRDLEDVIATSAQARASEAGKELKHPPALFQATLRRDDGVWPPIPIDEVIAWSRTAYGGRQPELFAAPHAERGCMRWGLCETHSPPEAP